MYTENVVRDNTSWTRGDLALIHGNINLHFTRPTLALLDAGKNICNEIYTHDSVLQMSRDVTHVISHYDIRLLNSVPVK